MDLDPAEFCSELPPSWPAPPAKPLFLASLTPELVEPLAVAVAVVEVEVEWQYWLLLSRRT